MSQSGLPFAVEEWREHVYYDVEPGDSIGLTPHVTAPETPGDYILEFDMTQEGVSWFGALGSKPLRAAEASARTSNRLRELREITGKPSRPDRSR